MVGTNAGELQLYRMRTGELVHSYRLSRGRELQFDLSPDHRYAYIIQDGTGLVVIDLARWTQDRHAAESVGQITALAVSPDGYTLATGGMDGRVCLWQEKNGKPVGRWEGENKPVTALAFSPDSQSLAVAIRDRPVRLCSVATAQPTGVLPCPSALFLAYVSPTEILVLQADKTAVVWGGDGASVRRLARPADGLCIATAAGPVGLVGGSDGVVRAYSLVECMAPKLSMVKPAIEAVLAPRKDQAISVTQGGQVCLWGIDGWHPLAELQVPPASSYYLAVSPDSQTITVAGGASLTQWHPLRPGLPVSVSSLGRQYTFVSYGRGEQLLAGAGEQTTLGETQNEILLWSDGEAGHEPFRIALGQAATCGAFAPDGHMFALGMEGKDVTLWNSGGVCLRTLLAGATTRSVGFSHDGRFVIAGDDTGKVRLWEAASGRLVHTLSKHTQSVSGVAFAPDDATVLSASTDGLLQIWDAASGLDHFALHAKNSLFNLSVQRDLILTTEDSSLRPWNFQWAEQRARLELTAMQAREKLSADGADTAARTALAQWYTLHGLARWTKKLALPMEKAAATSGQAEIQKLFP